MNKIIMFIVLACIDVLFFAVDPFLGMMFLAIGGGWFVINVPRLDP